MSNYRVKRYFMLETEHVTVEFNLNTKWEYIGYSNGYAMLHRKGVFIDVSIDVLERNFKEVENE